MVGKESVDICCTMRELFVDLDVNKEREHLFGKVQWGDILEFLSSPCQCRFFSADMNFYPPQSIQEKECSGIESSLGKFVFL